MKVKVLDIRDEGTFIPVLAVDMNPYRDMEMQEPDFAQLYLLRRCGYPCDGRPNIAITDLNMDGGKAWNDPHAWGGRTYPVAHNYIIEHWESLKDGDVIDVSFILGETTAPKVSERASEVPA